MAKRGRPPLVAFCSCGRAASCRVMVTVYRNTRPKFTRSGTPVNICNVCLNPEVILNTYRAPKSAPNIIPAFAEAAGRAEAEMLAFIAE